MKIWFNRGLSNTYDALGIIRASDTEGRIVMRATHSDPLSPVAVRADEFAVEPEPADTDGYVSWCLRHCLEHGVDVFVPQRRREAIGMHRSAFEAEGIHLSIMGTPRVMEMVGRKHELYENLTGTDVPIPPYKVFRTLEEFDMAVIELRGQAPHLCVKPCVGIYGAGFRILEDDGCELKRILSGDTFRTSFAAFRSALAESTQDRDMMLMAYLPGVERSVDVLAHRGRVVRAVARVKVAGHQVLETVGPSIAIAAQLTERHGLDGVFNLQTREWNGVPYLLEINSRMSGGLVYSCMSGVAFPYWNLMLTAGMATPEDVPAPLPGVKVAAVQGCIVI